MTNILLLEDLPEIRAWLSSLVLQVFPDAQIAEAVYITALFAFFNRVADAFGLTGS